jgi:hypothetical protein
MSDLGRDSIVRFVTTQAPSLWALVIVNPLHMFVDDGHHSACEVRDGRPD